MNKNIIYRIDAIDLLKKWADGYKYIETETELAIKEFEQLPSAQPEIIRCKDCEHWDTSWQNDYAPNYHYCPLVDGTRRDDFYCADAERRGEQDE